MSPPTGHRRAKSIETELEQLLSMNENCNDDDNEEEDDDRGLDSKSNSTGNSSKSKERRRRKIKYNRDDDPQHNENIDSKSVKSNKSKSSSARSHRSLGTHTTTSPRSRRSRNKESHHNSSSIPGLNNNDSTNSFVEEDDSNNKSNSRSPLVRTKNGSTRSRDSRKIRYNNNETTTMSIEERDRDEKSVSARSRKSYDSKDHSSNKSPNNNSNSRSTTTKTTTTTEEERSSKNRGSRRNIKYQKDEVVPESAQERDKDTRSTRSGGSGSRDNARSSRRRIHDGNNNKKKVVTGTTLFGESSSSSPHDRMSSRRRKVVKKPLDRKNDLLDEFEDWSSGDEAEEFPIKDNDNDNDDDNDDDDNDNDNDAATRPRELRRGINRSQSTMDRPRRQQRTRRGGLMRSMSQDVTLTQSTRLDENEYDNDKYDDDESHGIELNCNNNNSRGTTMRSEIPPRRVPRSASIKNASVGMVLGDPSRRAPPSRCKSGISPRESALSSSRAAMGPPSRSQSNDFSLFLRQGTKLQQQQRPSMRISSVQQGVDNLKFGVEDDDDDDNPFEVINKGPYESKSSRNMIDDMFDDPNNNNNDEDVHSSSARDINRRGNLIASKSGGLLQLKASSKDTMRVSARTKKIVVMTGDEEKQSIQDAKIERDKQRRAEYNRSIAAAASAGTIRMPRRASHRQVKRQNSSDLGDSISKLEATLESGQNELWN